MSRIDEDPVHVLGMRLARGEITAQEYETLVRTLAGLEPHAPDPAATVSENAAPGSPPPVPPRPGPAEADSGEDELLACFARARARLVDHGYHIHDGLVYMKGSNGVSRPIGTEVSWFRFGSFLGKGVVVFLLTGVTAGLLSTILNEGATEVMAAILSWLWLIVWGLLVWGDRSDYKRFEEVYGRLVREETS